MRQQAGAQDRLFYSFNLDTYVPSNHLLRGIDRFLELGELRRPLAPLYSHTGRPSIDPELMMRMLKIAAASAFDPSGGYATKFILIWPTDGSAVWGSRTEYRITRHSQTIGMAGFGRATLFGMSSRRCCSVVSTKA